MTRTGLAGALVVVALGVGTLIVGVTTQDEGMRTGANGFVNTDRPSINAHNSPSVAVDPTSTRTLAAVNRIDSPEFSCAVATSHNGGVSWQAVQLPLPDDAPNCYWPDVAYDADGRLLVLYTATGGRFNRPVGVWLQAFAPDGSVDGPAVAIAGESAFQARLAVQGDRVLVTWVQAGAASVERPLGLAPEPNPVVVAVSLDRGQTFETPVELPGADDGRPVQPSLVTGPDDQVMVGALDLGDDHRNYEAQHEGQGGPPPDGHWEVVTWTSADGGRTFAPPVVVADDLVIPQRIIVEFAPTPGFARDPASGRLYATWDAGRGDDRGVFLARSDDGGLTWSSAPRVAARPRSQFLPAVSVAPDGRVDVLFYDRSGDPDDVLTEVVLASSRDGGTSFATLTVSDRPFHSGIGLGSHQGLPVLSSQNAVVSHEQSSAAFWADTRNGDMVTGVQDLAVALVDQGGVRSPTWWLVGVGAALTVLGGLAPAWPPARRRFSRAGPRRA